MNRDFGVNQGMVEELFLKWAEHPSLVDETWRKFFENLDPADHPKLTSSGMVRAPVDAGPYRAPSPLGQNENRIASQALIAEAATAQKSAKRPSHAPERTSTPDAVEIVEVALTGSTTPADAAAVAGAPFAHGRPEDAVSPSTTTPAQRAPSTPPKNGAVEPTQKRTNGNGAEVSPLLPPTAEMVPFIDRPRRTKRPTTSFPPSSEVLAANELQGRVSALVNAFRVRGHLFVDLDPLDLAPKAPDELLLDRYGLDDVDPATVFSTGDMAGPSTAPLSEIVRRLKETYCRTIGVEFTFLEDPEARSWLQERMESTCNRVDLSREEQLRILAKLTDAEIFEQFLHKNYVGAKRFSLEGAESVIPLLDLLVERSAEHGVEEIVIGMAHRGRLNVLANILQKNLQEIFAAFEDDAPEQNVGRGDVKYHLGYSTDRTVANGNKIHLTLSFNPSHLEFVNPVVEGRVRAKQDRRRDQHRKRVLPLLIHGDAAIIGQGVVTETLNLSQLEGYTTGGTIHVVLNNQIGFTTTPHDARSARYCTDIVRILRCPVFHVNGEDPEAVAQVTRLATEYRQRYRRDVVIDMYCYRKYGHNENDEPRFTQPLMYRAVGEKKTIREVYVTKLIEMGQITQQQAEEILERRRKALETALDETKKGKFVPSPDSMKGLWSAYKGGRDGDVPKVPTSVPRERLEAIIHRITTVPAGFKPNKKVADGVLKVRREAVESGQGIDWGTAEWLAYGSLLADGTRVRLTGQDSRRGTFSHRHAVWYDIETGLPYRPFHHVSDDQAPFEVYDSPLSEQGVLGFEYGYSLDSPDGLVLWEAQFGDFVNVAQVIIDQFIVSSEDKWHRLSGLVLLLPHGFEGQGPEHSSARLERFLSQGAEDNIQVCNLTTPAQYFHCLRRQIKRPWRKPLIIMTPKSLLRAGSGAVSTLDDLVSGSFQRILPDDAAIDRTKVRRLLLCAGKVYYDLRAAREQMKATDVGIVRIEQLYPIRKTEIADVLAPYPTNVDLVWVQEEPRNMGAWYYLNANLPSLLPEGFNKLRCVSRAESASPATGSYASHKLEQQRLMEESFA